MVSEINVYMWRMTDWWYFSKAEMFRDILVKKAETIGLYKYIWENKTSKKVDLNII